MKVFCPPEVLEDHIAPASISMAGLPSDDAVVDIITSGSGLPLVINDAGDTPIPGNVVGEPSFDTILEPTSALEVQPPLGGLTDSAVRAIRIGTVDTLLGVSAFDFRDVLLQSLIVNPTFEDVFSDTTLSSLANELSISLDVADAIESAIGVGRPPTLVGLSSAEFERIPGSAFLTSL